MILSHEEDDQMSTVQSEKAHGTERIMLIDQYLFKCFIRVLDVHLEEVWVEQSGETPLGTQALM